MSNRALQWVYSLRDLPLTEKCVLAVLAWHHNHKTEQCNPSAKLIADEAGMGVSTVNKALVALRSKRLIEIVETAQGRQFSLALKELNPSPTEPGLAPTEQPHIGEPKIEQKKEQETRRNRARTPVPETLSEEMEDCARSRGFSDAQIWQEWRKFRNYRSDARPMSHDWQSAWENWLDGSRLKPEGKTFLPQNFVRDTAAQGELPSDVAECLILMQQGWPEARLRPKFPDNVICHARRINVGGVMP